MTVKLGESASFPFGHPGRGDPFQKSVFGIGPPGGWTPNVNLYESDTCYMVCVDLAGVDKNEIDVVVHEQRLKLTGKRTAPQRDTADPCNVRPRVHLMEIDHGAFKREVELPADVNQHKISASFDNGLLWIELPKE